MNAVSAGGGMGMGPVIFLFCMIFIRREIMGYVSISFIL